ncbi:TPA: winged helix-turn-helix domain-containing protein [Citrobacter braakii]|uniref:transcriptional regulator n=1 Tax=Citrobacter sp. RHBSTW-00986 TaxID=2742675 RepID=UPI0015EA051E|nr:winged helix-turn-helix domain-containing protein [Citrobacter sp. RHBSTW-00986]HCB1680977.1 winged helix-turn-helix domain-containing protein [Citrobacter braakii]QLR49056.1 winged helix-turn-helix domain-containing protein [Citrobacter sp. RHBSTW-00986]HEM7932196.1 winged helix-turn-helix domain-containing protein [Citrobacter braakii]HEM7933052.1 winged helix-turn-helix domain-containing protein [Citrobacter braakii]HEM7959070.1 winged helix-turn-helix domain-containing protein [Citrobac
MSIVVNNWRMDSSLNALIHCETGEIRRLGEYHFILLETLAKNADVVLSRSFLMTAVWKNRIVGGNSLPTAVHALRVAIDDDGKQQEIIKTIPKKGYFFNKLYLTEIIAPNENKVDDSASEVTEENAEVVEILASEEQLPSTTTEKITLNNSSLHEASKKKLATKHHPYRAVLITLPVIVVALSLFALISYFKAPSATKTEETPQLVKETLENANRITVYQLYDPGENKKSLSLVSKHILPGIEQINQLLVAHSASMTLYYRVSLNKLALDIVMSNQCNDSWQLALSFDNWLNKDNEMNGILIKEVEKMLNEMPKCK